MMKKIIYSILLVSVFSVKADNLKSLYYLSTPLLQEVKYEYDQALVKVVQEILKARAERNHYQELFENGDQEAQVSVDAMIHLLQNLDQEEKCLILQIKEIEAELEKREL